MPPETKGKQPSALPRAAAGGLGYLMGRVGYLAIAVCAYLIDAIDAIDAIDGPRLIDEFMMRVWAEYGLVIGALSMAPAMGAIGLIRRLSSTWLWICTPTALGQLGMMATFIGYEPRNGQGIEEGIFPLVASVTGTGLGCVLCLLFGRRVRRGAAQPDAADGA